MARQGKVRTVGLDRPVTRGLEWSGHLPLDKETMLDVFEMKVQDLVG